MAASPSRPTPLLELDAVSVAARGRPVLANVNLRMGSGECHVLFGPNGSGKTALVMSIMGLPGYSVTSGRVQFRGEDITALAADQRARRGIGLFYQRPPTVHGVSLRELGSLCQLDRLAPESVQGLSERLHCAGLLDRDVNDGYSGGEIKLSELLQLLAREPVLSLIDEPDAGVDVDNLAVVGSALRGLLAGEAGCCRRAALVITPSPELRQAALGVGVDPAEAKRAGSLLVLDQSAVYDRVSRAYQGQLELVPIAEARARHAWLDDYRWRALDPGSDRYTAAACLAPTGGFFLHVKAGQRVFWPLQTCLLLEHQAARQVLQNLIVVEEDAEVQLVTGCSVHPGVRSGLHVGATGVYLQRGASFSETMIHHWAPEFHVRPRVAVVAAAGSRYVSNYVLSSPALSVQSSTRVELGGADARAELRGLVVGDADSLIDLDVEVRLDARDTRADSISRAIARDRSQIFVRGRLVGRHDQSQGHLDCRGMVVSPEAAIHAIPELDSEHAPHCRLSHEAAVGPIDEEGIDYLTTRGVDREGATAILTRGFLEAGLPALPGPLERQIHELALMSATGAL